MQWCGVAEYADGTSVEKYYPYYENDNYYRECKRQQDIEAELIEGHEGCTYYSVSVVDDEGYPF